MGVNDDAHPAIAHFTADDRADIWAEIAGATIRRIGQMMIRGTDLSNAVYNAAANVTTALLGGPEALTGLIHDRDPAFGGLTVRRYMLTTRDVTGDNEATAASLAAVLQRVAARDLPTHPAHLRLDEAAGQKALVLQPVEVEAPMLADRVPCDKLLL